MFSDRSRINSRKKLIKLKKPAFLVKTKPFNEPLSNESINKIVNKKKTYKIRYTKLLEKWTNKLPELKGIIRNCSIGEFKNINKN
jgi:hypothetical protein